MASQLREIVIDCEDPARVGDVPWVVLADPEGNEFCLLSRRVDPA